MRPICETPGCEQESEARVSFFHPDYGGAICKELCAVHWALLMKVIPEVLQRIGEQVN